MVKENKYRNNRKGFGSRSACQKTVTAKYLKYYYKLLGVVDIAENCIPLNKTQKNNENKCFQNPSKIGRGLIKMHFCGALGNSVWRERGPKVRASFQTHRT